jgi:hypothetical protein
MVHIELDINPIPQLYGTSYTFEHEPWHLRNPSAPVLFGSCLSASLEMLVDHLKNGNRRAAYSSFRNAGELNTSMTKIGHPNGNEFTHLMWNQATLHTVIYGCATALVNFVGLNSTDGGWGMGTTTTSVLGHQPPQATNESQHVVNNQQDYLDQIRATLQQNKPMIACIQNAKIHNNEEHFPAILPQRNHLLPELPISSITENQTDGNGHAVVIAGMLERRYPLLNYPVNSPLDECFLLILDPAPSVELERYPERFYSPNFHINNPGRHTHKIPARDFLNYMSLERGLISLDS